MMGETADIVIVGGGVVGVSIAYHLAQQQPGRILLLERDALGSGSTGHSVASIDGLTLRPHAVALFAHSLRFFEQSEAQLDAPCGFEPTGSLLLAGEQEREVLATAVANMQAAQVESKLLDLNELATLEPRMNLEDVGAATFTPGAGYADPALTTQAFAAAARRLGVEIQQGRQVNGLLVADGKVVGVETAVGPIHAPLVIIAAGPWCNALLQTADITVPLQPVRHPVVCLCRPPDFGLSHYSLLDLTTGIYARPETGKLTLLGSIEPAIGHDPANADEPPGYVHDDYMMWVTTRLVQRFPALETSQLRPGWVGFMTITPDWQPIIGSLPEIDGLYCAAGFSGQGFQISPAVGHYLAQMILKNDEASHVLAPFAPDRFAGQPHLYTTAGLLGHIGTNNNWSKENG